MTWCIFGDLSGPCGVHGADDLDGGQQVLRSGGCLEVKDGKKCPGVAAQSGEVGADEGEVVFVCRPGELLGLGNAFGQGFPADGCVDRCEGQEGDFSRVYFAGQSSPCVSG